LFKSRDVNGGCLLEGIPTDLPFIGNDNSIFFNFLQVKNSGPPI